MPPVVDWYVNQIAAYGWLPVLTAEAVAAVAVTCATGLAFHLADRRRDRRALRSGHIPAAPDNTPGTDPELLSACRHIARQPLASRKEDTQ